MNWMKCKIIYFGISGIALLISIYAIWAWGLKKGIDFTGGTVTEYRFSKAEAGFVKEVKSKIPQEKLKEVRQINANSVEVKSTPDFTERDAQIVQESLKVDDQTPEIVRFENVGPTLSAEILGKTYTSLAIAAVGILLWVAWQFKSIQFGVCAVLATLHDSLILLGTFAILGHFKGIEVDILFVTAVLTVLSFSVHDTIVVYDRIRETAKKEGRRSLSEIANKALSETMVRSFNNSATIIFMLLALFLMGGETIRWFVFALLVGTISGTYSSPFVAVPLLVVWNEAAKKLKRN